MARRYLRDSQLEVPYLVSRWLLGEPSSLGYVYDDVGGIVLLPTGSPTLGLPSMVGADTLTSAMGGYTAQQNYFSTAASFSLTAGVTVEGVTVQEYVHGSSFYLFNAPGQAQVQVSGAAVNFSVWSPTQNMLLTVTNVLTGPPQLVTCTYDPVALLQTIYVDGVQVAQQSASGPVASSTTGAVQLLAPVANVATTALGQDIAVYNGALSPSRVTQNFAALMQQWQDPGHVYTYPYVSVLN